MLVPHPQPKFSPETYTLYEKHYSSRIKSHEIEADEVYTALAPIHGQTSPHEIVSFPVKFNHVYHPELPVKDDPTVTLGIRMALLTPDWRESVFKSFEGTVTDGVWKLADQVNTRGGSKPIMRGFLLHSLPNDLFDNPSFLEGPDTDHDPRTIVY